MNWRIGLLLYILGFTVYLIPASFQKSPGYMDAEYYYSVGVNLHEGKGFNEMLLWNYLDDPQGLPHPSNTYWMPFPSILAWFGMLATSSSEFMKSRIIFLAVAALVPPLTAALAFRLTHKVASALLAGALAIFPGFYLPYMSTSDAFSICMALGAAYFILLDLIYTGNEPRKRVWMGFFLGLLAGLLYLTRVEGLIWLVVGLASIIWFVSTTELRVSNSNRLFTCGACLAGFLLVVTPWLVRNTFSFGTPFPPGGSRVLWTNDYNQVFSYPAANLTFARWFENGFRSILIDRTWSFGQNLQTAAAIQGGLFLLPLVILGIYQCRRNPLIWSGLAGWIVTLLVMTLAFPYAGARGGFFHSGAAIQPLWWASVPVGLDFLLDLGTRKRSWPRLQAGRVFQLGIILLAVFVTSLVSFQRLVGKDFRNSRWDEGYFHYLSVEENLLSLGALPGDVVLVNNAPGYFAANRRPAISIPYGDLHFVLEAAAKFHARYLVLEIDQILGSPELYRNPGDSQGIRYLGSVSDTRIYLIEN